LPTLTSFDYAVLRVVPRVDREEFINTGVILFSLEKRFLAARVHLDDHRLRTLWPDIDVDMVRQHADAFVKICEGNAQAGPIARLSQRERFHWLVSPRSTVIQVSPVHSGLCESPETAIDRLFEQLVGA
jgi:hypothetical protein